MVVITDVESKLGSLLALKLLKEGENVTGIGESRNSMARLISEGMTGAPGDILDPVFMRSTIGDADTLFFIIPLRADKERYGEFFIFTANSILKSVHDSKIRNVFLFSSMGADKREESGFLGLYGEVEKIVETMELENVTLIRPGYFMDHLIPKILMIRKKDALGDVINGDTKLYFTDLMDVAENITSIYRKKEFFGRSKIELYSDKATLREATKMIGEAVGIPELPFVQFFDQDYRNYLVSEGAMSSFANKYVEMARAISEGEMSPSLIDPNVPNLPTRLADYIQKVFVPAFNCGSEGE